MSIPSPVEHSEQRRQERVSTEYYDGIQYTRVFTCPPGHVETHVATGGELACGAIMPVKWGGVSSSNTDDPRLIHWRYGQQRGGPLQEIIATFLSLDVDTASTTYVETARSRFDVTSQHERQLYTYGFTLTTGGPAVGDLLDDAALDDITVPVCCEVREYPHFLPGRTLIVSRWKASVLYVAPDQGFTATESVAGTVDPAAVLGAFYPAGISGGTTYYRNATWYLSLAGTPATWVITETVGTEPTNGWTGPAEASGPAGSYTPEGTATGTIIVAATR